MPTQAAPRPKLKGTIGPDCPWAMAAASCCLRKGGLAAGKAGLPSAQVCKLVVQRVEQIYQDYFQCMPHHEDAEVSKCEVERRHVVEGLKVAAGGMEGVDAALRDLWSLARWFALSDAERVSPPCPPARLVALHTFIAHRGAPDPALSRGVAGAALASQVHGADVCSCTPRSALRRRCCHVQLQPPRGAAAKEEARPPRAKAAGKRCAISLALHVASLGLLQCGELGHFR